MSNPVMQQVVIHIVEQQIETEKRRKEAVENGLKEIRQTYKNLYSIVPHVNKLDKSMAKLHCGGAIIDINVFEQDFERVFKDMIKSLDESIEDKKKFIECLPKI